VTLAPLQLFGDERLAQMAAAGDRRAFDVLFERHRRGLERAARSIVGNDHDAQDVLQSAALKAFVGLGARNPGAPPRPWLYRIASNEAITVLRRRRARPSEELGELVADATGGPEELLILREDLRDLLDDLEHISERQRAALLMRQALGLDYDEIGRRLDTSALAARQCVFSARRALRRSADGRDSDCATVRVTIASGDGRALRAAPIRAHLRICPECRAARPRRRVAVLFPVAPSGLAAALRALIAGPVDPVAAPAKALAVAAVLTVGTGGVARDVRRAPPKEKAPKVVARKDPVRHVARHRTRAAAAPAPVAPTPVTATPAPKPAAATVVRDVAVAAPTHSAPKHESAPQRRQQEPRPEPQARMAREPCPEPEPTGTSQPAPTPS